MTEIADLQRVLIGGPYGAPPVKKGDWLDDVETGRTEVGGLTTAPIPWPRRKKTGRPSLILTGALVDAVKVESVAAICHWWGVGEVTVWKWRKLLDVDRVNPGTLALYKALQPLKLTEEVATRGREQAATPEARAKAALSKLGQPAHPNTRAALLAAARRPKTEAWKAKRRLVTVAAIADELGVPRAAMLALVKRLEGKGFLPTTRHDGKLYLTRRGLRAAIEEERAGAIPPAAIRGMPERLALNARVRDWRAGEAIRKKLSARAKAWQESHPERAREIAKSAYERNRDRILARARVKYGQRNDQEDL